MQTSGGSIISVVDKNGVRCTDHKDINDSFNGFLTIINSLQIISMMFQPTLYIYNLTILNESFHFMILMMSFFWNNFYLLMWKSYWFRRNWCLTFKDRSTLYLSLTDLYYEQVIKNKYRSSWVETCKSYTTVQIVELTRMYTLKSRRVAMFFAVSDSLTCPDIETSWCHSGIIEHFEIWGLKMTP